MLCEGSKSTPRANCTDRAFDAGHAEGAALLLGRGVTIEPQTQVLQREQRYPPGELYRPSR
jgi:hypothetical protein